MTGRVFDPWIPPGRDPRWQGVRLLLVGESHYDESRVWSEDETRRFTIDTVRKYGAEATAYQRFFANTYAALTGGGWSDDWAVYRGFWNRVFFCNYVQSFVSGGPGNRPSRAQFEESGSAFSQTLTEVRPEAVLVLGVAVWNAMPSEGGRRIEAALHGFDSLWAYQTGTGEALAVHIPHPSSKGFSAEREHKRIAAFLGFVRETVGREPS